MRVLRRRDVREMQPRRGRFCLTPRDGSIPVRSQGSAGSLIQVSAFDEQCVDKRVGLEFSVTMRPLSQSAAIAKDVGRFEEARSLGK